MYKKVIHYSNHAIGINIQNVTTHWITAYVSHSRGYTGAEEIMLENYKLYTARLRAILHHKTISLISNLDCHINCIYLDAASWSCSSMLHMSSMNNSRSYPYPRLMLYTIQKFHRRKFCDFVQNQRFCSLNFALLFKIRREHFVR